MIDLEKAKQEFNSYVNSYDKENKRVTVKIDHTYGVLNMSEYIAKGLQLDEEDVNLAILIGLLHDIGRFDQAKLFNDFEDYNNMDHAQIGVDILFNKKLIRKFIEDEKYDNIIYKAILNHNRFEIEEGLTEKELLHAKIIRDADKLDNFRVKLVQDLETLCGDKEEDIGKTKIREKIFNDFLEHKTIVISERITSMDKWVSYIAFMFDINFDLSIKYIKEKDYVNKLVNRIKYIDPDTISKMDRIRDCMLKYIEERLKNN